MNELYESIKKAGDSDYPAEVRRTEAVAAALIMIASKASGADSTNLSAEMNRLSTYADQIQAALQVA
ncbi:hypothetical protein [Pseudomonas kurunegalensis]|uniref:hypothetical protein n=1 Tax=Pseudomonas kurunegalensis TaxID=485880 RepID=UPI002570034B|nr:hypothetical protein [Pseudomonas kurunegalensis]WJD60592.1 hypothetical protein QQ992_16780 [Pseudomonas kurunegalensis]